MKPQAGFCCSPKSNILQSTMNNSEVTVSRLLLSLILNPFPDVLVSFSGCSGRYHSDQSRLQNSSSEKTSTSSFPQSKIFFWILIERRKRWSLRLPNALKQNSGLFQPGVFKCGHWGSMARADFALTTFVVEIWETRTKPHKHDFYMNHLKHFSLSPTKSKCRK